MAFNSTSLMQVVPGSLANGQGAIWHHQSTDSSTQLTATGFFAKAGVGRDGSYGMRLGDVVHHIRLSTAGVPQGIGTYVVAASTVNQASTTASTGWNYARNVTVVGLTT